METRIMISSNYGFDHNWVLEVKTLNGTKSFYLGQDIKFIRRVMGMDIEDVVEVIGTRDISEGSEGNIKLSEFICETLGITEENVMGIESWELSCQ